MVKVERKIYLDEPHRRVAYKCEVYKLITVVQSNSGSYTAVLERLFDEKRQYSNKELREDQIGKKGDIFIEYIDRLRVVEDLSPEQESERITFLTQVIGMLGSTIKSPLANDEVKV